MSWWKPRESINKSKEGSRKEKVIGYAICKALKYN